MIFISLLSCHSNCKVDAVLTASTENIAVTNSNIEPITKHLIPDLYFGIDSRGAAIKKTDIDKATSIYDFLNEGEQKQIEQINFTEIVIINNGRPTEKRELGRNAKLTAAQIKLLRSSPLFTQFSIKTNFNAKHSETGVLEERFFNPHLIIVPAKQASYINGEKALINYLRESSKENMTVIKDNKLNAVMIYFTVTKQGTITNVYIEQMITGYPSIDQKFVELIKNLPGKWSPAKNVKGELIDQELVFTFGPKDGC